MAFDVVRWLSVAAANRKPLDGEAGDIPWWARKPRLRSVLKAKSAKSSTSRMPARIVGMSSVGRGGFLQIFHGGLVKPAGLPAPVSWFRLYVFLPSAKAHPVTR